VPEAFQPVAVRPPSENRILFRVRCFVDLQLLTIFRFLVEPLSECRGRVLDVGAGEAPWRDLLSDSVDYVGVDADLSDEFGMRHKANIIYYDGQKLPFSDASYDYVLCTEVLEHVKDPAHFLADLHRVLHPGGKLILTVPWSARLHHLPHDYNRFTRFGLLALLDLSGFSEIKVEERGNDIAVIANKLLVVMIRLLYATKWHVRIWSWVLAAMLLPFVITALVLAHVSMFLNMGSKDDPLGYGVIAKKN